MKNQILIVMLGLCLTGVCIAYYNIFEEKEELELHYQYAMEMAKIQLNNPEQAEIIKEKISVQNNNSI